MSADHKNLVRRWFEQVWNQGRADAVDEMMAPDATAHGLGPDLRGPKEFKAFQATFREAFPNLQIDIDDLVAEGDKVAYRWTASARHDGHFMGIAPTGKSSQFTGMGIVRVKDGRIAEGWNVFDQLTMLQQLGIIDAPAIQA